MLDDDMSPSPRAPPPAGRAPSASDLVGGLLGASSGLLALAVTRVGSGADLGRSAG
jgi:hypothetical protein